MPPKYHTPIVSRIMENLINDSLIKGLLEHELISTGQHGFLHVKSCAKCMIDYFMFITRALNMGRSDTVVILDRTNALDVVLS